MVDQLRLLWNRPLRDGDRRRLVATAVALIAAAAVVLALLDRATAPPRPTGSPPRASAASTSPATPAAPVVTVAAEPRAPSEEGQPPPALEASHRDVAASKRAARRFLGGYLPYTYDRRSANSIRAAVPRLLRRLRAQPPRVPVGERRRHARVIELQSDGVSHPRAHVTALVDDGRRRYTVELELAHTRAGWTVTELGD